jgi:chromosome segregation ATPase
MSGDQLEEAEVDRLGAAVFEQRRLSHMLRQRGAEIEALETSRERLAVKERQALEREEALRGRLRDLEQKVTSLTAEIASLSEDRDRVATELGRAQYEARREERRVAKTREEAAAELAKAERDAAGERERAGRRLEEARAQLSSLTANRDSVVAELQRAQYEARRAERRLARTDRDAAEARKRARLQLDALHAELREGLGARDEALKREQRVQVERDEAQAERDEAQTERDEAQADRDEAQAERDEAQADRRTALATLDEERRAAVASALWVEASALQLGRVQCEVELLAGLEKEREILLAGSERTLSEVAVQLRRVRDSRSWRWGNAVARAIRMLTFRRRSKRSALDAALERLGAAEPERRST